MEALVRQLTESRIREILAGMAAFREKVGKLGGKKGAQMPLSWPVEDYPPATSVAEVVAPYFSDDSDEVPFYQDVMRLQELWTYVNMTGSARGRIEAAIEELSAIKGLAPDVEKELSPRSGDDQPSPPAFGTNDQQA